ncbi:hypothetical protein QZH41_014697 [Actinostola sp. cb2023]|nr:hypothetical protein QZH41_014697 [Actinostola sp. cb2023]
MSWAKDEWKDGLNVYVLKHITELEQQNERIAKDNKQKQFQIETQTAAFLKQKRFTEEEKGRNASLKRENQSLSESCDEAERSNQKLQHEIHLKDGRISCVEGQLNRLKQSLDHEISKQSQLKADLEKVQCEHTQSLKKFEKQCADLSKIQEHNNFQKRQIEGQKEKIKSLITQLKHGDFEVRSSRSSSQSSSEGTYDDYNGIDLQAKLETEVQQRQRIEQELKQLQEQQNIRPKEAETPVTKLPSESHNNLDVFTKEGIESSKMELEYKNSLSKIELQLQASKNELMNKIEVLKERDVQLAELKQNLDEQVKESGRSAEDLMKTKTELDRTKSQFELFERKSKQLTQELQCQRHNSEAVIKGHEERIKEKEKQYREELSTQSQALVALDKQHRDLMAKMKQEQNITQAAQRELHGKLDQKLQEAEKLKRQLDDIKLDGSNKDHAMKTKEQTINDLSQEIKSLKQEKTCLLTDLDREASCKKKLEDQLKAAKSEIELKSNLMKNAETKATEQVKELEKIRQQVLCDLENERTVRSKLEHDIEELKKLVNASTCSTEKRENEVEEVKKKLEVSDKDNQRLCQETQQLKVTISEQNDQQLKFEAKLKEVDQVTVGKDNETRNMVDKLEELEKKCSSLLHELDNKSQELEISKRTNSELQSKQENMQKILTAKEMEVKNLKKTAFEIETQQSSAKNAEVSELERRLDDERQSCKRVQDDCNKLKSELNDGKVTENELRYKLQEISTALKENQDIVSQKEKEIEGERKNIKSSMQEFKEKIALLKKEKEQQKQEMSKTIHQNSEEICVTLDELNKKTEDVVKLRQTEINLQNLLTTRELEKGKMEDSYKDLCEKTQKREEELLYNIEQLQTEKASLSEKERNLIITKDTLKRDIKALQNDYKKACDLSDAKSEELKELIDKYVVSQKAVQQFQQRMIHAENSLKGCEQRLKDTCQEKDGVLQELAVKEEKLDAIKKELSTLSQEKHSQMASVQESVKEFSEKLNGEVAEKEKARKESQNLAEKLDEVQTALQNSDSQLALLREKSKNSNEIIHKKDQEINDLFKDLKSTESQIQNLEQKLNEKGNSTNELEQRCRRLELQHEEMSAIIKTKENEIVLHVNELENLKSVSEQETISLRQQVDTLEKEVTELRQKSPQLEDALRTKENEVLSTKDDLLRSIESLTQAQNELQLKVQELSELSSIKSSLEIKLNDAMGVVNEKQLYIDKQTKELNELQAAFDSRLSDVDSRREKEEAEMLQGKLQQLQQSLETSENKLNEAQEEMNVKHAELMDAHKECHKFKSLYDEIEKREADLLEQTQNLSASLDVKAKELETEREEHEKQQSTYDTYTSDYLTKECQLKEKIDGLTNELERITSCLNNKEEELKTALEKISSMKNECEELRSMMDESAEMAMNLEDQNLELKEKNEHLVTSLEGRNKDLAELKESQKQTEMSWMTSGEKYAADMEKRNDDVNILKQKLSRAHEIEESKANEIKSLKQRIDSDAVDKESIVSKMESLQSSNAALLEENSVLNQKMHHLSEITTIKDAEVATKTEELEGLKKKLDLEAQESLRVVADLTDKNSVLTARIVQHDEMMAAKHLELKDLRSKFEELSKEFDELKSHLEERTSTLESTREELRSLVTKTETLENLFNSKNDEMAIKSEELLKTTSEQQAEFQRKCDMLSSTTDTLNTALSEKEHLSHVLEAKEKDLLKLSQLHEENTKEKEDIIHKLSVVEDSLNVKSEEVKSLLDQQVHLKSMVSNLITEKDLIAKEENCTRLEANEEVTVLKGKLHELEEKVNTLVSVKEKLEYKSTHKEEELQKAKDLILQLQKDVDSLAAQKEILQMDFEDKDDVIDSLQKQISQHEQLVTELKHRSQEKEEKYISVTRDMEALRSQFEVTQMDIEDKEDVIEELKTKSQALESCVKSLKESNCVLEESLKKSQTALDETAKSLDDKTLDLETTALESGSMHLKAEELIQTLREAVDGLNKENRELESKANGNESLVQSLKQEASDFQERIEAQNYEKQNMESVFSSNVMTWKQSKEALERQVQEFEKRLSVSSEAMETSKDELAALRTSMETERTNMSKNKQELLLKKESSEDELKATREKLQEYEEALVNTKNELAYATESKDLAESMLVAVDGNLQNCKHQLLEKENQLKVLERSLGGKEDEIVKLRDLSTLQQERLENVNQGLNANQQEKETQIREMLERMQNIEKCKEMEIESLSGEYKTRIDEIQKRHELSLENVEQYKVKLTELEGALSSCKQEIVELNQRIDSNLAELQTKGFEIENLQTENKRFLYSRETLQNDLGSDIEWLKNEMSMTEEECSGCKTS